MAEETGLIHARLFDGHGGARTLRMPELASWNPHDGVLWVHFDYTKAAARDWIRQTSGLDSLVAEALITEETRPRAVSVGDGLLLALRGVNLNPGAEPDDMVSIRLWLDASRVVSSGKRDLLSVRDLLDRLDEAKGPTGAGEFIVELTDRLVWRMSETVEQLEDSVAGLEDSILEARSGALRLDLASLRRQTITLRRYLAPQREALSRLITEKVSWIDEGDRMRLREIADRLMRHIEDLDAVRDRAAVAHEELLSRISEQLNSRLYVLSIVAALFLPLGFLTGMLGINVGGIPGADNPWGFLIFAGTLALIVVAQIVLFRRKGWL